MTHVPDFLFEEVTFLRPQFHSMMLKGLENFKDGLDMFFKCLHVTEYVVKVRDTAFVPKGT